LALIDEVASACVRVRWFFSHAVQKKRSQLVTKSVLVCVGIRTYEQAVAHDLQNATAFCTAIVRSDVYNGIVDEPHMVVNNTT
jgi:hypothetical protein